jgi:thiol-disulfide isomerase/thioredoxin
MKHRCYFFLFPVSFAWAGINAQTAPDFTVTDSWGQTHSLYSDYLNLDKTVVLKIFYVACPPCNSIAPHLEPLYQSWGGGQGDVQFIELSIKADDSDAEVSAYKLAHGTTYPAAGGDGNSVPATVPYTNGTFGLWGGTPTFVVIAPDGTLQYDVYGAGIQGTIEALNTAIAATGAQGLPTAVTENTDDVPVSLVSNIVGDELHLKVSGSTKNFILTICNTTGQTLVTKHMSELQNNAVRVDLTSLNSGLWICRIDDEENRFMASYLFIKI